MASRNPERRPQETSSMVAMDSFDNVVMESVLKTKAAAVQQFILICHLQAAEK